MQTIRVGQVDLVTGELLQDATLAVVFPKRRNGFSEGWLAMSQNALMSLARADLGAEAQRVLFALLSKLDFENSLSINQSELARDLGMRPSNMSRAVARLVSEGVVLTGPTLAGRRTYSLNPTYGWKGSARGHRDTLIAQRGQALKLVELRA